MFSIPNPCGAMEAHQTSNLGVQSSTLCMDAFVAKNILIVKLTLISIMQYILVTTTCL